MSRTEFIDPSNGKIFPQYIPPFNQVLAYGSFCSTTSQTVSGSNAPTALSYNTTEIANLTNFVGSRIYVQSTGIYRFAYSIQLDKSGGGTAPCEIYIAVNGTPVPRSTGRIVVAGQNGETLPYCDYILPLNAGQYLEVYIVSADATMTATYFPAVVGQYPEIPSIISNIQQIA